MTVKYGVFLLKRKEIEKWQFEHVEVEKRLESTEDLQAKSKSVLVNEMFVKENKDLKSTNGNLKKVIAELVARKRKAYKTENNIKKLNQSIKRKTKVNINCRKKFRILSKKVRCKTMGKNKNKKSLSETKKSLQNLERANKLLKKRNRERAQNEKVNNINKIADIRTEHKENINALKERYEDLENQLEGLHKSIHSESEF